MGNAVVHFEIGAAADGPLTAFYGELFNWDLQGDPGSGYTVIDTRADADGINGGIGKIAAGPPYATFYVETDDLQATLDRVNSLGGTTAMPATDIGGGLTIARFGDPDGLLIGLIQAPAGPAEGGATVPSAGSGEPVTWFEVMGADAERTQQFYAEVFDWTVDTRFPGYGTVETNAGRGIAGGLGGGTDARWAIVYARVTGMDEVLSRVEKLGGSVIADQAVPTLKAAARAALYGSVDDPMKTAAFRDPAGNIFGLFDYGRG
jgi:predicted enzyme related to lactoylglutathione lyase